MKYINKMKFFVTFGWLIIFSLVLVSAVEYLPHKQNTALSFSFTDDIAGQCNATTMDIPNGTVVWLNLTMSQSGNTFSSTINSDNFSLLGIYCINLDCIDGYGSVCREVTPNGEIVNQSKTNLSIILLSFLVIFFIISLVAIFKIEDYKGIFVLYWVCHLLLLSITFIAWQTSANYLSMGGGIGGIFKILFYFTTIAVFPMIILSLTWIFYIHTFNEHFAKLIENGGNTEDAFRMAKRKTGGWFNGR